MDKKVFGIMEKLKYFASSLTMVYLSIMLGLTNILFIPLSFAQIKVAILDTGLDLNDSRLKPYLCASGHKDFTHTDMKDRIGHGTHIAGLITKFAGASEKYCLVIYKTMDPKTRMRSGGYVSYIAEAFKEAIANDISVVNFSGGGPEPSLFEWVSIRRALQQNIIIVVAAGNEGSNLAQQEFFPASYGFGRMVVVGNLNQNHLPNPSSNYGCVVNKWEVGTNIYSTLPNKKYGAMTGTSQATAITTGKIVHRLIYGN